MDTESSKQRTGIRTCHDTFVLTSCCLATVLHTGFLHSIGVLFTDVMTTFNSTHAETAVIQSTAIGMSLCSSIFTGALINKIGLMVTGMLGNLVVSLSLMVCFFASSLTYLIIAIGVFSGFGFSCVYITSASAVSQHFSGRKRLLYLSVQTSGAGIGGMIYPFVIRYLSDLYGFRGSLLITGALVMNTVPGSILWKQHCNTSKSEEHTVVTNKIGEFQTRFQVQTEDNGENITIAKSKQTSTTEVSDSLYVSQYPVLLGEIKTKTVTVESSLARSPISKNSKGSKTLPIAIGMFRTLGGICEMVAGPISGYIRDVTGSYTAIFYTSAGINLFAAVLFLVAHVTRRRERQELKKRTSVFYLTSF
ncbi:monocarboxylate transporter 12-like isoform X4 [Mercenaria mercenaria]|uniref:monocarboxylate transporter 12-like isoform X4 n=1 Tax=Mercenaria mercenaria TaxID=6596 RepID=UPI00234EC393|nr:monocarboxylate transporter 12-like isoform X4 [Mercenaria mercenaria]